MNTQSILQELFRFWGCPLDRPRATRGRAMQGSRPRGRLQRSSGPAHSVHGPYYPSAEGRSDAVGDEFDSGSLNIMGTRNPW